MMSTTSSRSGSSDNSYDFLSAEEKECLLFLEETIGSLDTETDSGLSAEELEPAPTPPIITGVPQGKPEERSAEQVQGPRIVAQSSDPPKSHCLGLRSGSYSLPRNLHLARRQNLRKSAVPSNGHIPETSAGLLAKPEKGQVSQSTETHQAPARAQEATLDLDIVLIPPPEAFQDITQKRGGKNSQAKETEEQSPTPQFYTPVRGQKREETPLESMSHKAPEQSWTRDPQQSQVSLPQSSQDIRAEESPPLPRDKQNVQPAPFTAQKPRKLPPNIVLKSSRSSFHNTPKNWLSHHTEAADSGAVSSSLQEQRKARREALEKLGLPQDQDDPSHHVSKHASSLRFKGSSQAPTPTQPAAPALVSAASPAAGKAPGLGPSPVKAVAPVSSPGKVAIPAQEPSSGKVAAAKSMPIPIPKTSKVKDSLTQSKPDSGLTLQESSIPGLRQISFKSNTLERSGVGLSSYLSAADKQPSHQTSTSLGKSSFLDKISPSVLRNSRPRPASLGMEKDFAGIRVDKLTDPEQVQSFKHLSYKGQSHDKLPRPPCVSVKISPKGIPDEHRKEALKKLGLLKESSLGH